MFSHIIIFQWLLMISLFFAHPIHVSVSELVYHEGEKAIQITQKVFFDDLEDAIYKRSAKKLHLGMENESVQSDEFIIAYLKENFSIRINSQPTEWVFIGKEYEADAIWIYLEIPNQSIPERIEITNTILQDLFDDQKNLLHISCLGRRKSHLFDRSSKKMLFKL